MKSSSGNPLIQVKAGIMKMGDDNLVKPDNRRGYLYLYKEDCQLLHFCWRERSAEEAEIDLFLLPNQCEFLPVHSAKNGRIFHLKFIEKTKPYIFWMQEVDEEKDEETVKSISALLRGEEMPVKSKSSNNLVPSPLLMHFLKTIDPGIDANNVNELRSVLNNLNEGGKSELNESKQQSSSSSSSKQKQKSPKKLTESIDLCDSYNRDVVNEVLMCDDGRNEVIETLPEQLKENEDEPSDSLMSQHFRYALSDFCAAFQTTGLSGILKDQNYPPEVMEEVDNKNLEEFADKLEKHYKVENNFKNNNNTTTTTTTGGCGEVSPTKITRINANLNEETDKTESQNDTKDISMTKNDDADMKSDD
ncbi:hypothetical protein SNEBB_009805 [Seison nebaliae]|nr:hypothetical protein SNEBB_009805 [Seison nebaliae]